MTGAAPARQMSVMRIVLLTLGSRGDVQPFVALGLGLQAAGHQVTLCTAEPYAALVREYGLPYAHMDGEFMRLADSPEAAKALASPRARLRMMGQIGPLYRRMLQDQWQACLEAEAIIQHPKALGGEHIAEKLGIPLINALAVPALTPTRAFPNPTLPLRPPAALNRATYGLFRLLSLPLRRTVNAWRRQTLNLPSRRWLGRDGLRQDGSRIPVLYAYSPHVVPDPPDWPETTVSTGYWFLPQDDEWQPSAALAEFLQAGPPPVYVGFGGAPSVDPLAVGQLVRRAVGRLGLRAILATGRGGLAVEQIPAGILLLEKAPHDWLFPRVAAVVHHGGAGTTGAGLRAGKPTLVCPFSGDQPFWGQRVHALGAGPAPIPIRKLTVETLAAALERLTTDSLIAARADELGRLIRGEDGVGRAVAWIESYLATWRGRGYPWTAPQSETSNGDTPPFASRRRRA